MATNGFDGDGRHDLMIVSIDNQSTIFVSVLYGGANGFTAARISA